MKEFINILNVKLPFIEAVEYLKNDNEVIACVCNNVERPCIIMLNNINELRIVENNIFDKPDTPLIDSLLSLDNILENKWFLIIRKNTLD